MSRESRGEHTPTAVLGSVHTDPEELAAELTEAAFPVALRHGFGTDWLERKLELWNAMTRTVSTWEQHAHQSPAL
jgi:hypothetical protein